MLFELLLQRLHVSGERRLRGLAGLLGERNRRAAGARVAVLLLKGADRVLGLTDRELTRLDQLTQRDLVGRRRVDTGESAGTRHHESERERVHDDLGSDDRARRHLRARYVRRSHHQRDLQRDPRWANGERQHAVPRVGD